MDIATPLQPTPPAWLQPLLTLLLGLSVVYRKTPLSLFAMAFSTYWIIKLGLSPSYGSYAVLYSGGCQMFTVWVRIMNGLLLQSGHDFTRAPVKSGVDTAKTNKEVVVQHKSTWRHLGDAVEIGFMATRGVGWNYQVKNIPPVSKSADYPRVKFVVENLLAALWRMVLVDGYWMYLRTTPMGSSLQDFARIADAGIIYRIVRGGLMLLSGRFVMDAFYRFAAAVMVGFGWYSPVDWPPLLGRKRDMYTVRRFWSHTWHQMMRAVAEPSVNFFARNVFRIPKGSYLSNYFKVFGAFFVAYAAHGYGTYRANGNHMIDWNFFMSQAVAIWVEETVVKIVKGLNIPVPPTLATAIGYLWTGMFIAVSSMFWQEGYASFGAFVVPPFGYSPVEAMFKQFLR